MSGVPSWRDDYDRMHRWHARLRESPTGVDYRLDDFHAFFVVCFHLKDWLQADPSIDKQIRDRVERFVEGNLWLRLVADLANGSKHLQVDRKPRYDSPALLNKAQSEIIVTHGSHSYAALKVADRSVAQWDIFLEECGLL